MSRVVNCSCFTSASNLYPKPVRKWWFMCGSFVFLRNLKQSLSFGMHQSKIVFGKFPTERWDRDIRQQLLQERRKRVLPMPWGELLNAVTSQTFPSQSAAIILWVWRCLHRLLIGKLPTVNVHQKSRMNIRNPRFIQEITPLSQRDFVPHMNGLYFVMLWTWSKHYTTTLHIYR